MPTTARNLLILLAICFIVIVCGEIIWTFRKRRERLMEQENQILMIESSFLKEYYITLENQTERTRKFHHDIKKHMAVLTELAKQEGLSEQARQCVKELEEDYDRIAPLHYCDNPVVNAVLVNKLRQCQQQGIRMEIEMSSCATGTMPEIDMIALIANLLDNAIEECVRVQSKRVTAGNRADAILEKNRTEGSVPAIGIKCGMQRRNLILQIRNSTTLTKLPSGNVKTRKTDDYAHGVGLKIIEEILEKYKGTMTTSLGEGMLEQLVQLPLEEKVSK